MKKKIFIFIAVLVVLFLAYQRIVHGDEIDKRNAERESEAIAQMKVDSAAAGIEEAEKAANTISINQALRAEPKILDFTITDANVLYAVVKSDGTKRNGYAEYLCQLLKDNGMRRTRVKIIAAGTSKSPERDNPYGILIGESNCDF